MNIVTTKSIISLISKKYKGNALLLALFVVVIISLITLFIITLSDISNKAEAKVIRNIEMQNFAENALELSYNTNNNTFNFFDNEIIANISDKLFGVYLLKEITVKHSNLNKSFHAISGYQPDTLSAIQLANSRYGVTIGKHVQIVGNCYFPSKNMAINSKNIKGQVFFTNQNFPQPQNSTVSAIQQSFQIQPNDSVLLLSNISANEYLFNSFTNKTLKIICNQKNIKHYINGNVMLISTDTIFISSNSKLNNVIIYAPKIIVEENTYGKMQLFAEHGLEIKNNVTLKFPSAAVLLNSNNNGELNIGKYSNINGAVILIKQNNMNNKHLTLQISNSTVNGLVYSNDYLKIDSADITGMCIAREIYYKDLFSMSINKINNVTIQKANKKLSFPVIIPFNNKHQTINWLPY